MNHFPVEKKDGLPDPMKPGPAGPERNLLGRITLDEMYRGGPEYKQDVDAYPANPDIVGDIKKIAKKTSVLVFMGWWCPDSASEVPKAIKVLNAAANPNLNVEIYSVDQQLGDGGTGLPIKYNVEHIPTIVFTRNDVEIGRIVEAPKKTMEEDVLGILKSSR